MKEKRLDFDYKTSKDYEKLFELVFKQRVICIVTYTDRRSDNSEIELKDICASGILNKEDSVHIGSRGIGFIEAFPFNNKTTKEDFLEQCKHYKLEYIDPDIIQNKVKKRFKFLNIIPNFNIFLFALIVGFILGYVLGYSII